MTIFKSLTIRVFLIAIISIAIILFISIILSYQWNESAQKSFLNFQTFSQFLAGFGALLAVLIALFINQINKYFDKTDIILDANSYDGNFDYNFNEKVVYYLHLKVINKNLNSPVNNFTLLLEPAKFGNVILDIPRPFSYASNDKTFEKNIQFEDFINLCWIEVSFISELSAILTLWIDNNKKVEIDILKKEQVVLSVLAFSSSFKKSKKFQITIKIKTNELEQFIKKCKNIRDNYIKEKGFANDKNKIMESFEFEEFYKLLSVSVQN